MNCVCLFQQQVQSTSDHEEEVDPDGVFAFRRKKGCHYLAVSGQLLPLCVYFKTIFHYSGLFLIMKSIFPKELAPEDDQSTLIKTSSCNQPVLFRTIYYSKEKFYMMSPQTAFCLRSTMPTETNENK